MAYKLNISEKGKAWKLDSESDSLTGKKLGEAISGKDLSADLIGYELIITGATDKAGFAHKTNLEGTELRKTLLINGWGMHRKPKKEGKKKVSTPKGLRLRKTYRGNHIGEKTAQINLIVKKNGSKSLKEIFPDQNQPKEKPAETPSEAPSETQPTPKQVDPDSQNKAAEKVAEEIKEEVKEEIKEDIPISAETKTENQKSHAAEKVAEEVKEEVEDVAEEIAEEIAEDEEEKNPSL